VDFDQPSLLYFSSPSKTQRNNVARLTCEYFPHFAWSNIEHTSPKDTTWMEPQNTHRKASTVSQHTLPGPEQKMLGAGHIVPAKYYSRISELSSCSINAFQLQDVHDTHLPSSFQNYKEKGGTKLHQNTLLFQYTAFRLYNVNSFKSR
jgi:hypothetical protein